MGFTEPVNLHAVLDSLSQRYRRCALFNFGKKVAVVYGIPQEDIQFRRVYADPVYPVLPQG